MEQIFYYITYIIAISLQLSAGLLLVGNTNISRKGIIKEYCLNHTAIAFEENGTLVDDGNLKKVAKCSWINRIAFFYLFIGYLIGVFGEPLPSKEASFLIILVVSTIATIIGYKIADKKGKDFAPAVKDDIPMENGVCISIVEK